MIVRGLKCYFVLNRDDDGEPTVTNAKFKGASSTSKMTVEEVEKFGRRDTLMKERTVRMCRSSFGVCGGQLLARVRPVDSVHSLSDLAHLHGTPPGRLPQR